MFGQNITATQASLTQTTGDWTCFAYQAHTTAARQVPAASRLLHVPQRTATVKLLPPAKQCTSHPRKDMGCKGTLKTPLHPSLLKGSAHSTNQQPAVISQHHLPNASQAVGLLVLAQVMVLPKIGGKSNLLQKNLRGTVSTTCHSVPLLSCTEQPVWLTSLQTVQAYTAAFSVSAHLLRYQQLYTTHMSMYQPTANCC